MILIDNDLIWLVFHDTYIFTLFDFSLTSISSKLNSRICLETPKTSQKKWGHLWPWSSSATSSGVRRSAIQLCRGTLDPSVNGWLLAVGHLWVRVVEEVFLDACFWCFHVFFDSCRPLNCAKNLEVVWWQLCGNWAEQRLGNQRSIRWNLISLKLTAFLHLKIRPKAISGK